MSSGVDLGSRLAAYRESFTAQLLAVAAPGRAPALDSRLRAAGLGGPPGTVEEFESIPVLRKDDLPALQEGRGYADLVGRDAQVTRVFASPGPIYEPQLAGSDPWRFAAALEACGIGSDDLVINCFNYHLSPAGTMFDEAARALGARVLPGGVGMTEVQARAIADLGVTAFIGLPSYLAALVKAYDAAHDPSRWQVTKALVTAEPLPPPLRASLRERVSHVLMAYGTAEVGLIGYETAPDEGLRLEGTAYVELCEPGSDRPVAPGDSGEVVVTLLRDETYPLVRFGTGDVSRFVAHGDGGLRLAGVLGRVGAAVKVRGMFVHPHQAASVRDALRAEGVAGARFVVQSDGTTDSLVLEVALETQADDATVAEVAAVAERRAQGELRLRPTVQVVDRVEDGPVLVDLRHA
ncbi:MULTISPECIES: phenylacetate--CoA ligase family protein [Nocardioides]|uniref:Phenylacetate--CoA ligase family protein n=1 Tax=Nocardioides vastitatis TaxID=2568655 RepID=A0ABW0ZIG6_9ACTN|nr:AMP-binding protein [Nocardioides sp.]THJ04492.1 phenylacetate--CoA ligase [Nocardioides sp.]